MAKICYVPKTFSADHEQLIVAANRIIAEYRAQGFVLTLRQLYYQFVARDWIANKQTEYKRLGGIISDARLAGLIDWEAIEDRTRKLEELGHWDDPGGIMADAAKAFHVDRWAEHEHRVEVWIEKDALVGVIEDVCRSYDVPYLSCRGYLSQSEAWRGGIRIAKAASTSQAPVILHLGDHDPSGIDMSRDLRERLELLADWPDLIFERIALNMPQIEELGPPPNPAKVTDSRFEGYVRQHGPESWELDALEPSFIAETIERHILKWLDVDREAYEDALERENEGRAELQRLAENWGEEDEEPEEE